MSSLPSPDSPLTQHLAASAIELPLAHTPLEVLAVIIATASLVGTLVYARHHHQGRCTPAAALPRQRCACQNKKDR